MVSKSVCLVGDRVEGHCSAGGHSNNRPFYGYWINSNSSLDYEGTSVILTGDTGVTDCGHTFVALSGSSKISCDGKSIHRVGDSVQVIGGGTGESVTGSPFFDCE